MSETLNAIHERRSVRAYQDAPVPEELISQVIEAGLWAASGMGKQSPLIVAITDRTLRDRLASANRSIGGWGEDFDPFYGAPVVLVVLAPRSHRTRVHDGSLVMGNLMLAAHELGLGSCWIHRAAEEFEQPEFRAILDELGVDPDYAGVAHCILGYPAATPEPEPRREGRVLWVR